MAGGDECSHPAPAFETLTDEIGEALDLAARLCSAEDPVEEPYRSKYKAREVLLKAKQSLSAGQPTEAFFEGVVGKVRDAAGVEDDEVDLGDDNPRGGEGASKRRHKSPLPTEVASEIVTPSSLSWHHPVEAADCLMQLGLLWSSRSSPRTSVPYLLASVDFLRKASSAATADKDDVGGVDGEHRGREHRGREHRQSASGNAMDYPAPRRQGSDETRARLESLLTHAFYYLAQAYGAKDAEQSAKYCAITLQRQLDAARRGDGGDVSFEPGEWSRNACFLADFYSGLGHFPAAGECLVAAQAVLDDQIPTSNRPADAKILGADDGPEPPTPDDKTSVSNTRESTLRECEEHASSRRGQAGARQEAGSAERAPKPGEIDPALASASFSADSADSAPSPPPAGPPSLSPPPLVAEAGNNSEERTEQRADVDRHVAKLYIAVLDAKHQEHLLKEANAYSEADSEALKREQRHQRRELEEKLGLEGQLGFDKIGAGELPMCDPLELRGDFETVRDVFKKAKSHTERALQHYVLDGFVTAHVALHQGLSRAYMYLASFEQDAKRRQAMCSRRAQALEPLLECLGMKAYLRLHKELSHELAEIYQDLVELRISRSETKAMETKKELAPADTRAVNKLLKKAIGFLSHFIALYHDGQPGRGAADSTSQPAGGLDAEEASGYLRARFTRARLVGKQKFATSVQTLQALRLSCADFAWLVEYAGKHLATARQTDPNLFVTELQLAEEMLHLQRRNMANIERSLPHAAAAAAVATSADRSRDGDNATTAASGTS